MTEVKKHQCSCGCVSFYLYIKDKVAIPKCVDCEAEGRFGWQSGLIAPHGFFTVVPKG